MGQARSEVGRYGEGGQSGGEQGATVTAGRAGGRPP